jgi:hypothetical protein
MRKQILEQLKQSKFRNFTVSDEIPFSNSGTELYLKNVRKIYVDVEQVEVTAFIPLLNELSIDQEVHTVKVYFATDAKQLPTDYSETVTLIRNIKNTLNLPHGFRRDASATTRYENDILITEIEFTIAQLI